MLNGSFDVTLFYINEKIIRARLHLRMTGHYLMNELLLFGLNLYVKPADDAAGQTTVVNVDN